jgi:hypothetical protein
MQKDMCLSAQTRGTHQDGAAWKTEAKLTRATRWQAGA